ncbi:hydroxyacid dehydrogenase [Kitasatospora mediocidica]|uniref:hydroxyacid dehydrogenase n=1 Tax=Kitasatospora mediocidica TaxID=58352 RepID=UPI0009FE65CF|nr:hydroxyacid dehydrogenase [Kitasatospora mediocidica]
MTRPVVLIADPLPPSAPVLLGSEFEVRHCDGTDRAALLDAVAGAAALVVRSGTTVDAEVFAHAPGLRVVARAGVGLDNVDLAAARLAGVLVRNAPASNVVSVAELTVGLILSANRRIAAADASVRAGRWERSAFQGEELAGRTVGIVGLGRVGTLVARRLAAFEMRVLAHDPQATAAAADHAGAELVELDALLANSDVLTVHVPKTAGTVGLIGARELALLRPGAYLVNTSRGGVVDERALAGALASGRLAGAALDVFETEPATGSPLLGLAGVTVTPHLGASTRQAQERAGAEAVRAVREVLLD